MKNRTCFIKHLANLGYSIKHWVLTQRGVKLATHNKINFLDNIEFADLDWSLWNTKMIQKIYSSIQSTQEHQI